jgi:hypothetical protein
MLIQWIDILLSAIDREGSKEAAHANACLRFLKMGSERVSWEKCPDPFSAL